MNVMGIDVGAGAVKSAVFAAGRSGPVAEEPTAGTYPALRDQLLAIVARHAKTSPIAAVGIGVPGFISLGERIVERSPNMRFLDGQALERDLAAASPVPVVVENDANAAALGEFLAQRGDGGHSARPASFVLLTLGSGVGSGIVLDGRLWRGADGFAGELGHLLVNGDGRPCGCGNSGCAETECSESGIVRSYREYSGKPEALSSREVFDRLGRGDEAAARAFRRAGAFLGVLLGQIVYALNPRRIAVGGGVAAAGEALLAPARSELARRVVARAVAGTEVVPAVLGNGAGMAGAAALARGAVRPRRSGAVRPRRSGAVRPRRSGAVRP
jgi:glucokinase